MHTPQGYFASSLIGTRVFTLQGEALGSIEDVFVPQNPESVPYAVLSHGGVLGSALGAKRFAVPFKSLQKQEDHMALDISLRWLEQNPGFDQEAPPGTADMVFAQHAHPSCAPAEHVL